MENGNLMINLSSGFRMILKKINNDISRFILTLEDNMDYAYPFSYLDLGETEDTVSFILYNKYKEIEKNSANFREDIWSTPKRVNTKIGRIVMKLAPFFSLPEIEKFVNSYKTEYKIMKNVEFKLVEGDGILKYYNAKYNSRGGGSLNKSCMRYDHCIEYMKLYKYNADKIKMLVLADPYDKNLIVGRALVWFLDEPEGMILMDRVYTVNDSDMLLFKKYAEKNGWIYKSRQTFDCIEFIQNEIPVNLKLKINIKGEYKIFPYIDTLLYYDKEMRYLTNDDNDYKKNSNIVKLREINGGDSGNENFVFDIINEKTIDIQDAIFCFYEDGYTHKDNVFFIDYLDEYCSLPNLRYSTYMKRFIPSSLSVYSKKYDSFMNKNDVIKVYFDKSKKKSDFFLRKEKEYMEHSMGYFIKDILVQGIDGNIYFKDEYNEEETKRRYEERKKKMLEEKKRIDDEKKKMYESKYETKEWSSLDESAKSTWVNLMKAKKKR